MFGSDIPFADGEFPVAVLVTAWLVKFFTSEGDVVWELCEDNRPHVSLAAIALGRRAFVVVAEDKAEKAQTRLQAVQDYHNAPTKWNMYHNNRGYGKRVHDIRERTKVPKPITEGQIVYNMYGPLRPRP